MFYRDSSVATHTGKGLIAGHDSSHAVRIEGGSTGGVVEAIGDDANISLTVKSKGSGLVAITGGTGGVNVTGSSISLGSSVTVTGTFNAGGGNVNLGSTTFGVNLLSSAVTVGSASTTGIALIQRYRIDWTVPALSSAGLNASFVDSTITLTGATTNSIFLFQERVNLNSTESTAVFVSRVRCSTADELRLTVGNCGASTISGSTMSGYLLQFKF